MYFVEVSRFTLHIICAQDALHPRQIMQLTQSQPTFCKTDNYAVTLVDPTNNKKLNRYGL